MGWKILWPLTPAEEHKSSMYQANHSKWGQKGSPSPHFSLSIPSKGSSWDPLRDSTTEALSYYRGGTNPVSGKMLHLELCFASTLSKFLIFVHVCHFKLSSSPTRISTVSHRALWLSWCTSWCDTRHQAVSLHPQIPVWERERQEVPCLCQTDPSWRLPLILPGGNM